MIRSVFLGILIPSKYIQKESQKKIKNLLKIEFPVQEKDFWKIETKNNICINGTFPIYVSDQKFENSMDLLLVIDKNKSYYVYIKDWQIYVSQNKE